MKEIIFWFSNHRIRNYWFDYALNWCRKWYNKYIKYNKLESWIQFCNLKISFKVETGRETDFIGRWDINQYWVEDLFDNNFVEFFITFIREELKNNN